MFWIIKRLFWIVVFAAVVYFGVNYKIDGRPVKQYILEFYRSPIVQAALQAGKEMVVEFLEEKVGGEKGAKGEGELSKEGSVPVGDHLKEEDRKELEAILKKQQ